MNTQPKTNQNAHPILGWLCIGIGCFILLMASELIPVDPQSVHVPMPILALTGLVVTLSGTMILIGHKSRFNDLMAAILLVFFAIIGGWIALFSPSEKIEGGLPFLPHEANATLGKILFGLGALICIALSGYAFSLFRKK